MKKQQNISYWEYPYTDLLDELLGKIEKVKEENFFWGTSNEYNDFFIAQGLPDDVFRKSVGEGGEIEIQANPAFEGQPIVEIGEEMLILTPTKDKFNTVDLSNPENENLCEMLDFLKQDDNYRSLNISIMEREDGNFFFIMKSEEMPFKMAMSEEDVREYIEEQEHTLNIEDDKEKEIEIESDLEI